jgi:hypothetical protein
MMNRDTIKGYNNDSYNQKTRQHSLFHDLMLVNTRYTATGRFSNLGNPPFVVDWQMHGSENKVDFGSPPVQ